MPTILTCTDGSLDGTSICLHTAWAATSLAARVQLLHILDHHRERAPRLEEAEGSGARLKGKAILAEAQRQLTAAGLTEVTVLQRHGTLVETLTELEPAVDLVVVGKRGEHADFVKGDLGENLENIVRVSIRPVLVASRAFKPITRMLLAFDDGPSALKATDYVATQPLLKGLECHLLMVDRADAAHQQVLSAAVTKLRQAGYDVCAELKPGSAAPVIAEEVKRREVNLLVMVAFGHSPLREFILGSTTRTVVQQCLLPVLMFR